METTNVFVPPALSSSVQRSKSGRTFMLQVGGGGSGMDGGKGGGWLLLS